LPVTGNRRENIRFSPGEALPQIQKLTNYKLTITSKSDSAS